MLSHTVGNCDGEQAAIRKAEMPMLVTLLEMLTEVRLVHDRNALNVDNQ
jgi:hypothetical protein